MTTAAPTTTTAEKGVVYIYQDINYGGRVAALNEGRYNLAALQAKGFKNDDLSSLKLQVDMKQFFIMMTTSRESQEELRRILLGLVQILTTEHHQLLYRKRQLKQLQQLRQQKKKYRYRYC